MLAYVKPKINHLVSDMFPPFMMDRPPARMSSGFPFATNTRSMMDNFFDPSPMFGHMSSSSSTSSRPHQQGFSSKSVTTTTRTVNGVVQTVRVTRTTDEHVRMDVCLLFQID